MKKKCRGNNYMRVGGGGGGGGMVLSLVLALIGQS